MKSSYIHDLSDSPTENGNGSGVPPEATIYDINQMIPDNELSETEKNEVSCRNRGWPAWKIVATTVAVTLLGRKLMN